MLPCSFSWRTTERSSSRVRSTVFPLVISAALIPIGMTALTLGTDSRRRCFRSQSTIGLRSGSLPPIGQMANSSLLAAL